MPFARETSKKLLASLFFIASKPKVSPAQEWSKPRNFYIALGLNELNEQDTGCSIEEPESNHGYKRVNNRYWKYESETNSVYNSQEIVFYQAKEIWGDIKSIAICDEIKNGNVIFYQNLDESIFIDKYKQFYLKIGNLKISLVSE